MVLKWWGAPPPVENNKKEINKKIEKPSIKQSREITIS